MGVITSLVWHANVNGVIFVYIIGTIYQNLMNVSNGVIKIAKFVNLVLICPVKDVRN